MRWLLGAILAIFWHVISPKVEEIAEPLLKTKNQAAEVLQPPQISKESENFKTALSLKNTFFGQSFGFLQKGTEKSGLKT